jgi:phage baseplate assembly protein W
MPIISGIKRINPLDLNKNVKIGVAFPLNEENMFNGTETIEEQTKANLINLLLTEPGERVNIPRYGVGLKKLLFEQNIDLEILREQIIRKSAIYIPNIKILNVVTRIASEDRHTILVAITYKSLLDGKQDSIQLNFN